MTQTYDLIVIGAGPGGYVAAIRAAQLGMKVAVVEREHLGGICLNWGCIPTKSLLRSAEVYHLVKNASQFGLSLEGGVGFDISSIVQRSRRVSSQLNGGVGYLLKKNKVDIIWGEAAICEVPEPARGVPGAITVSATTKASVEPQAALPKGVLQPGLYRARHIVLATGARPRNVPGLMPDGQRIWAYFEAMKPASLPKSVIIVGSGAIGIEFASFYRTMGAAVTVVEMQARILPAEDEEISQAARAAFEKQGMSILTNARVENVRSLEDSVTAEVVADGGRQTLEAERMIVSIGVEANVSGLGLENAGVELAAGVVKTDGHGRTSVPGIWAIGDVAGAPMLAHKAEHEGIVCVETIKGLATHAIGKQSIPACTYCDPQIASIGLTEAKARELGHEIRVGKFSYRGNGKAVALGAGDGLIKTVYDAETGKLLGAHLIGAEVTELIQGFAIALRLGGRAEDLIHTVFPHPTLSEMIHESALDSGRRAIHM
ncbi:MAG: dihydrolipoamide dehydrogenase [Alphaproteobacteria bacterium BRH_c36]|nr:MAG: dihydrolipoamide dehydrogenase [Alphaproteobacteria bacterium BRH_c36]